MNNRSQSFDLTTTDPNTVIEVKVRYSKPDGSCIGQETQGYWLNATPVKLDGIFRVTTAYTGVKKYLEGSKRFSAKRLDTLMTHTRFEILTGHVEDPLVQMVLRVAEQNDLTINQWSKK